MDSTSIDLNGSKISTVTVDGDTVFPDLAPADWQITSCDRRDDIHSVPVSFKVLERVAERGR